MEFIIPIIQYKIKFTSAVIVFPGIYVISDAIVALTNRRVGLLIVFFGIVCDGLFSYSINYFTNLNLPNFMTKSELSNTLAVNYLGTCMWSLYYNGVLGTIIASLSETYIFYLIYRRLKSFFVSTIISIAIVLIIHNLITDYLTLQHEPDVWQIIINNWILNVIFMFIYTIIIVLILNIKKSLLFYFKKNI